MAWMHDANVKANASPSGVMGTATPERTMASVLTYNAPDALRSCLQALFAQTARPSCVLVIDNASTLPAMEVLRSADVPPGWVRVLRMNENLGPAGGHAAGLQWFLSSSFQYAWVLDDDFCPAADCLASLLRTAGDGSGPGLIFPTTLNARGSREDYPRWCGVLIPREAVVAAGVPRAELFWWTEDTEYLQFRLPMAGFPARLVTDSFVRHSEVRRVRPKPAWKIYYETRNFVYYRLYTLHGRLLWKLGRYLARVFVTLLVEDSLRGRRVRLFWLGLFHGLIGRLGKTIEPDS